MMKVTYALFLFLPLFSVAQNVPQLEAKIDKYVQAYLDMDAWSGVIAIHKNNAPVFQKAYGYADREWSVPNTIDTKFRIASISKIFTEVAILQLVENGQISLEDQLSKFIPDYPNGTKITIKHLLTHRSGIPHLNSFPNYDTLNKFDHKLKDLIGLFKHKPLDFQPDERYRYSNSGYVLLAFIIEQVSSLTYEAYLQKYLFDPFGLRSTGIDKNKKILANRAKGYMFDEVGNLVNAEYVNMSIKIGGGSLYSTVDDLQLFVHQLLQKKILNRTLMELPNFSNSKGQQTFTASGRVQGYCHQIIHRMEDDLTIIILGNNYSNIALPMSDDIYKIYANQPYVIPQNYLAQKIKIAPQQLKKYEGTYDFGFGPIGVVKELDGQLAYGAPGRDTFDRLIPLGEGTFFYIQSWVLLKFTDLEENKTNTLEWIMGENTYPAKRTIP